MADHRERSLKITFTSCSGKGPTEMKRGKEKNTKKKKFYKTHPQRINVLGNCKLLIFSAHYHNFQITASSDKKAIT